MDDVRRGDVVVADLDPTVGVDIKKIRPAINRLGRLVVIVPLTTNVERRSPRRPSRPRCAR